MRASPEERFWEKVAIVDGRCWEWLAYRNGDGYGTFNHLGKMVKAHRLSYEWRYGSIPDGAQVDHVCHNPACVNPSHLRLATNETNCQNRSGAHRDSKSGVRGVSWDRQAKGWRAYAHSRGKQHHLGVHASIEEAEAVVVAWRRTHMPYSIMDQMEG